MIDITHNQVIRGRCLTATSFEFRDEGILTSELSLVLRAK